MFETVVVACDNCKRPLVLLEWEPVWTGMGHAGPAFPDVFIPRPDGLTEVRSRNSWARKVRAVGNGGRIRLECGGKRCRFTKDAPRAWQDAAFRLAQEMGRRKVFCSEVDQALKTVP